MTAMYIITAQASIIQFSRADKMEHKVLEVQDHEHQIPVVLSLSVSNYTRNLNNSFVIICKHSLRKVKI